MTRSAVLLLLAALLAALAPGAADAKRSAGAPPSGFADSYKGHRGTLRVSKRDRIVTVRVTWRVTLKCSNGKSMPSARGVEDDVGISRSKSFTARVPTTVGTATLKARWRGANRVTGTLTLTGFPGAGTSVTCHGSYPMSFSYQSRKRL